MTLAIFNVKKVLYFVCFLEMFHALFCFSVQRTAARFGFREVSEDDDWSLFWTDFSVALERAMEMKKYQVAIFTILRQFLFHAIVGPALSA